MALPRLSAQQPIVTTGGKPSSPFLQFMEAARKSQEATDATQDETLEALQAVQEQAAAIQAQQAEQLASINEALQLAGLALETADGAVGGATRSAGGTGLANIGVSYTTVVQIDLLTVSAGNLTFPGSFPGKDGSSVLNGGTFMFGTYRVIEVEAGIDIGVVFTGAFTVQNLDSSGVTQDLIVTDTSSPAIGSVGFARTTTGSVSYRLEAKSDTGGVSLDNMLFYLFARRS